ncbi:hypothetical protein BP6252_03710 [Coleophoma cylindrospora]|uniref:Uncharacterized protein n=1 Tax=Coleophoma cylindrospora TaxID=1849047 RepID=A0A3D8S9X1_9HELO|nr:hypothetical protein BP6252_03710 [Coleophoma cylindrospora]
MFRGFFKPTLADTYDSKMLTVAKIGVFVMGHPLELLAWLFGLILFYLTTKAFYNVALHPLRSYPGPKLWAASHIPWAYYHVTGDIYLELERLHRKYGPVVRVAPNNLSYTDPDAWNDIYTLGADKQELPKASLFRSDSKDAGIIGSTWNNHQRIRGSFKNAFSTQAMKEQEPRIISLVNLYIQRLHEHAIQGPVDLQAFYVYATFDIMGDLAFGESFGCLEGMKYHRWINVINDMPQAIVAISMLNLFPPLNKLVSYLVPKSTLETGRWHRDFAVDKVNRRIAQKEPRSDFMTYAIANRDTPRGPTMRELEVTAGTLVIAGSETSASLLGGLTFHLLKNPDKLANLTAEIRSSFSSESDINMTSVNSLKYALAVVDEAMRIFPPVPGTLYRVTNAGGNMIAGRYVPPNTDVGVAHWATYHSPDNFKDPYKFVPERWLGDPAYANDNRHALQPFQVGPRNCIGRNLAYAEIKVILARTLWNFDMQLCEESEKWTEGLKSYFIWVKRPLMVKLTPVSKN